MEKKLHVHFTVAPFFQMKAYIFLHRSNPPAILRKKCIKGKWSEYYIQVHYMWPKNYFDLGNFKS